MNTYYEGNECVTLYLIISLIHFYIVVVGNHRIRWKPRDCPKRLFKRCITSL